MRLRRVIPLAVFTSLVVVGIGGAQTAAPAPRPPRVFFLPPAPAVVEAMLKLAKVGPNDVVYDLGSGDGRIPITAVKEFGARGVGIEIDPALVARAKANARDAGVVDKVE